VNAGVSRHVFGDGDYEASKEKRRYKKLVVGSHLIIRRWRTKGMY